MQRGERHFGGRNHIQFAIDVGEHRVREFRKLPSRPHRRAGNEKGRHDFRVTAFVRACQKERDERPRESRARAAQDGEAASRKLCRAFEVDDAEGFAELPVRLGNERGFGRRTRVADGDVVGFARAVGHGVVQDVGNVGEERVDLQFERRQRFGGCSDARVERRDVGTQTLRLGGAVRGSRDLRRQRVLFGFELLCRRACRAQLRVGSEHLVDELRSRAAPGRAATDALGIAAQQR